MTRGIKRMDQGMGMMKMCCGDKMEKTPIMKDTLMGGAIRN